MASRPPSAMDHPASGAKSGASFSSLAAVSNLTAAAIFFRVRMCWSWFLLLEGNEIGRLSCEQGLAATDDQICFSKWFAGMESHVKNLLQGKKMMTSFSGWSERTHVRTDLKLVQFTAKWLEGKRRKTSWLMQSVRRSRTQIIICARLYHGVNVWFYFYRNLPKLIILCDKLRHFLGIFGARMSRHQTIRRQIYGRVTMVAWSRTFLPVAHSLHLRHCRQLFGNCTLGCVIGKLVPIIEMVPNFRFSPLSLFLWRQGCPFVAFIHRNTIFIYMKRS